MYDLFNSIHPIIDTMKISHFGQDKLQLKVLKISNRSIIRVIFHRLLIPLILTSVIRKAFLVVKVCHTQIQSSCPWSGYTPVQTD